MIPAVGTPAHERWRRDAAAERAATVAARAAREAAEADRKAREALAQRLADTRARVDADVSVMHGRGPSGAILREVAEKHGCTVAALVGPSRLAPLVRARHEAMWRLKNERGLSLNAVAQRIGGRDHKSVMYGLRKHEARLAVDAVVCS